jgi:RNA polymerase sigma-70 factor (ECF subfamily)
VIAINRALAVAEVDDAAAGLASLPDPADDPRLETYQPYWAARAELLSRVGAARAGKDAHNAALADARRAYDIAIGLERDPAVRNFLLARQRQLP